MYAPAVGNVIRTHIKDGHLKAGHEQAFRPAKHFKIPVKSSYIHLTDYTEVKKNYKDEEGHVKIAPKNMVISMGKKANSLAAFPTHKPDEYDYAKKVRL